MSLQEIFSSYIKKPSIFTNKKPLSSSYIPENIPYREKEIETIASILAPSLKGEKPSNIFCYGKTGTGKSLCVNFVVSELLKSSQQTTRNIKKIYVNCKMGDVSATEYRVLAKMCNSLGMEVPVTGLPTQEVYDIFYRTIDDGNNIIILILDEIDALVKKTGDEILYNFLRINEHLKNSKMNIIGVTNDLQFEKMLEPRVKSSLNEEEILFRPYNALELKKILEERAKIAFNNNVLEEGVISKCAALAAQEHGDARRALDLLRISGEIAERKNKTKVAEGDVDDAQEKINVDRITDAIAAQPRQSQAVLWAVMKMLGDKIKLETGMIFKNYKEICKQRGLPVLTQRRVSDLISELAMLGIIDTETVSKGRYGRTREISVLISEDVLDKTKTMLKDKFYFE